VIATRQIISLRLLERFGASRRLHPDAQLQTLNPDPRPSRWRLDLPHPGAGLGDGADSSTSASILLRPYRDAEHRKGGGEEALPVAHDGQRTDPSRRIATAGPAGVRRRPDAAATQLEDPPAGPRPIWRDHDRCDRPGHGPGRRRPISLHLQDEGQSVGRAMADPSCGRQGRKERCDGEEVRFPCCELSGHGSQDLKRS